MSELARSPEQLGNAIRRARKKRGMSQSELGEKAGLRQETISLIENGNPAAKLETILAVLSALGLELHINPRVSQGLISAAHGLPDANSKITKAAKGESGVSRGLLGTGINEPE
jgi:HTH-type transcriptional regulator / antitoxin HipB